jgi:hypothetical protein
MSAALVPAIPAAAAAAAADLIPGMRVLYNREPAVVVDGTNVGRVVLAFMNGPKREVLASVVDVKPHTLQKSFEDYVKGIEDGVGGSWFGMNVFVDYLLESGDAAPTKMKGTVHSKRGRKYRVVYPSGDWDYYTLEELKAFKGIYEGPDQSLKVEWLEEDLDSDVRLFVRVILSHIYCLIFWYENVALVM